jgi:hypothetical protein
MFFIVQEIEKLTEDREFVRHQISEFPQIMEGEPDTWWKKTAKLLINFKRDLQNNPNPEIRNYFDFQINSIFTQLRDVSLLPPPNGREDFASLADHMIMKFSMEIAKTFEPKELNFKTHFLPLNEMVKNQPDRFRAETITVNERERIILFVKHPIQEGWQEIILPKERKVWHKGGPARAVLDIVAGAPISMQESEFPWHDYDAVVAKGRKNKRAALNIGVDPDGIEYMGEDELNFPRYCAGRDTTQNQVCLGAEGLYYSDGALIAARTGHTRIESEYVANKAIYGIDKMIIQGESLAKPRGLMRLIKAVTEGKALSFDYIRLNAHFDLGTHINFLARRWSKKDHFPERLQRMFYLLKQMNQIRPDEHDIFDTLERAHKEYSFFDFDSEVHSPIQLVRWKAKKLVKQIDREMGWKFRIPTGLDIERVRGDTIPLRISLEGFTLNQKELDIEKKWNEFLERSRERTKSYQAKELTPYEIVFKKGYSDIDELGTQDDDLILYDSED